MFARLHDGTEIDGDLEMVPEGIKVRQHGFSIAGPESPHRKVLERMQRRQPMDPKWVLLPWNVVDFVAGD